MKFFQSKMKSVSKAKMGVLILVGLVAIATYLIVDPFKVTNPADPRFNPDKFQFSDYEKHGELWAAYKVLFPIGTPKEFVERVLIDAAGSTCGHNPMYKNLWTCRKPWSFRHWDIQPAFTIVYDKSSSHLLNITVSGNALYPDSPKSEYFMNLKGNE